MGAGSIQHQNENYHLPCWAGAFERSLGESGKRQERVLKTQGFFNTRKWYYLNKLVC